MNGLVKLALVGAVIAGGAGSAMGQTALPVQYPPPPGYGQPGYGPPPGYPPPPPPGYGRPDYPPPDRPMGFRCDAEFQTPRGPREILCPLEEPRPLGRRCQCPPPPAPPGYPPLPPAFGRVTR